MNNVRVQCPGATNDAIQLVLFSVMDKFFKDTNLWKEDIDFTVPGMEPANTVYQLTPTGPCLIDKLMWVYGVPAQDGVRGQRVYAYMSVPGELTLHAQPSSDEQYRATVALTVADPTQRDGYVLFPKWVLDKYRDTILNGLLGSLLSTPSKPWTNNQLSVYYLRKWTSGLGLARVEGQRNNVFRAQAWAYPAGFSRGSQTKGRGGFFPPQ